MVDEEADVRDRVVQHDVGAGSFQRERLVEVGRAGRVERHERPVGAIDVRRSGAASRRQDRSQGGLGWEPRRDVELLADPLQPGVEGPIASLARSHGRYRRAPMNMPLSAS